MNNINFTVRALGLLFFLLICLPGIQLYAQRVSDLQPGNAGPNKEISFPKSSQFSKTRLNYKIVPASNNTWCYDIYADGKLMIHQYSIPAIPGNQGFKTKLAAEKVALLVIEKIKKGEMPPTVSVEEMRKLKAIK